MDLSDEQIDKLLQEAEQRLASQDPATAIVSSESKTQSILVAAATTSVDPSADGGKKDAPKKRSHDVSLRVPSLAIKKDKVCGTLPSRCCVF